MINTLLDTQPSESCFDEKDLLLLDASRVPHHIAIVMDGNRRWAKKRQLPAMVGHAQGCATLIDIVEAAEELGVRILTVYGFSTENWQRSPSEVDGLLGLIKKFLSDQRETMVKQGVHLETIGDLRRFPRDVLEELDRTKEATKECTKIDLVLALNYGGRDDICRAAQSILEDFSKGHLNKDELTETLFESYLDTAKWRDPELFIRTSGEKRLSNFLLWQLSYAEVYITDVLWPDFNEKQLLHAILDFQQRDRRWGG